MNNNNNNLINLNDNNSQNNESEEEIKINDIINLNDNNPQKRENEEEIKKKDLIQDEKEKSFMIKQKQTDYDKDSEKEPNNDFSMFEPSRIIDKEHENDLPRNSKINDNKKSPLSNSKHDGEKSFEFIISSINNEDDKNLQKNANPPLRRKKKKNNSTIDIQKENSKSKNTSINNNNNEISKIYENNDEANQGSKSSEPIASVKLDAEAKNLLDHYTVEKLNYSEKIIDRVEYKKALVLEKDLANKKSIVNKEDSSKKKEKVRSLYKMFKRMILNNNTIIFVFRCYDNNDCHTKIVVGILSACLYIFVNLLIMIEGHSLHLYLRKDKGKFNCLSFFVNLFFPYFLFYF